MSWKRPINMSFFSHVIIVFVILIPVKSKDKEAEQILQDGIVAKVDSLLKEIQVILKREALQIHKEKEAFESVAKKIEHVHFSSTIKLNVGGQIFTTSLQTLTKDAGSMLHAMFSGRFDVKPAEDGSYFIDRDGTCFRHILNYLRTGKLLLPDEKVVRKEVLEEARFYQIQGIIDELDPHYGDSVILSSDQADWLIAVHGEEKKFGSCRLLYRASRDGWHSSNFHSKCDSFNGPTMVVIKSTEGYIFGGYTEQSWSGGGVYKSDYAAFLFSLVNAVETAPVKMKLFRNQHNAVYCDGNYGPIFGGNHDLLITSSPNTNDCNVNIGHTYEPPPGQSVTSFLTGGQNFNVAEMEVFGLEKG